MIDCFHYVEDVRRKSFRTEERFERDRELRNGTLYRTGMLAVPAAASSAMVTVEMLVRQLKRLVKRKMSVFTSGCARDGSK